MSKLQLDAITQRFIEPLTDATKKLFRPIRVMDNDRLKISLDDMGKRFMIEFYAINTDGAKTHPSWSCQQWLQRVPERKILSGSYQWMLAATDFTAIIINALWPADKLVFDDDARLTYEYLLSRFLAQTVNSRVKAEYHLQKILPAMPTDFIDHPVRPLADFQKVGLYISLNEDSNLWMQQGTGKTPIVIARINYEGHRLYAKEKRMYRALIVVPKNMRMNWHNKIVDFSTRSGKVTVLRGGQLDRVKLMVEAFKQDEDSEYTIVICSYESVVRSWEALRMIEWDLCCLDEAHMIKSQFTHRWKKMSELRELCKKKTELTGTPIANNLFDVYTQFEFLGEGLSGFTSYKAFKAYYGKFVKNHGNSQQHDILVGYQNLPILQERIARLCFMITRKEALPNLPEKTYDIIEVDMTPFQRECYVALQKELALEIQNDLNKSCNKQLTANNILVKLLRLSQITAGYLKWDAQIDEEGNVLNENMRYEELTPNNKIDTVVQMLKEKAPTDKTIIWTNWVAVIKMLNKRLMTENIKHVLYYGGTNEKDRQIAQDTYNMDPTVKVFIGNPAAGGLGLDLWGHMPEWVGTSKDHGCNTTHEIYYSQNWSMIHRSQSEDRAMRRGTRATLRITDVIVPGTIDEEIALRVLNKAMTAIQLQDVKNIMERLLTSVPNLGDKDD